MNTVTIIDGATGNQVTRSMTSDEQVEFDARKVAKEAQAKAESDAKALNDAKVLSAKNKLKALGLTEAEVTALVG